MEPACKRTDDAVIADQHLIQGLAAMEPTGVDGRGTSRTLMQFTIDFVPQWSRPMINRMTHADHHDGEPAARAAMGPAVDRPDDLATLADRSSSFALPQWSRPLYGRMSHRCRRVVDRHCQAAMEPTGGRSDDPAACRLSTSSIVLQWGQSLIDRMTDAEGEGRVPVVGTAMGPAVGRSEEDQPDRVGVRLRIAAMEPICRRSHDPSSPRRAGCP